VSHWLVILEPGEDYEIEHEPECPTEVYVIDPRAGGGEVRIHTCLVGALLHEAGLEVLDGAPGEDWRKLSAGRYEIEGWTQRSPSGPWGPEEWDAGIMIVESK
jgi:hypothetical protein